MAEKRRGYRRKYGGERDSYMRPVKELYLSIFVLFYGMSGWEGRLKADTASIGVSVVVGLLAVAFWALIQTATHQYVAFNSRWIFGGAGVAIFVLNNYFLVVRGRGVAFEKQFRSFSKSKRIILYLAAIGFVVAIGIAFYLSVAHYRQTFNIHRM